MKALVSYSIAALVVSMLLFGALAARHIDRSKMREISNRSIWLIAGPLVPEEILTPDGKRWAFFRNVCAALLLGGATVYAIAMAVIGEWS